MGNISIQECFEIHDKQCKEITKEVHSLEKELISKGLDPELESFIPRRKAALRHHVKERKYYLNLLREEELWKEDY
jgi:hypothetical protein